MVGVVARLGTRAQGPARYGEAGAVASLPSLVEELLQSFSEEGLVASRASRSDAAVAVCGSNQDAIAAARRATMAGHSSGAGPLDADCDAPRGKGPFRSSIAKMSDIARCEFGVTAMV